ncbi:MAG: 50S ribosomal protein L29 [Clostridiales bacterium]|nr:50S ribosomal protein L29 [Clostridiales bacterium]
MKVTEVREMTDEQLLSTLKEFKSELFALRFRHETGQLDNPMQINLLKKDIARVKTIIRERNLDA